MLKRLMNILTVLSVILGVFSFKPFSNGEEFFELLGLWVIPFFLIGIINYIFFNKVTLWHKQPKK